MTSEAEVVQRIQAVHREHWSRLTARLVRITGDWAWAEDCVQEAFAQAWKRWPEEGIPDRPEAWLTTVARHRAIDQGRRSRMESDRLARIARDLEASDPQSDDRLALVFTCCHPALPLEGRVALTLRAVAGLSTAEVARAFLVSEDTMNRRLSRARAKIKDSGIPFRVPDDPWQEERLEGVLGVVYLLFNRGNDAGPDEPLTFSLATEALRLSRLLVELLPRQTEPAGLLALILLTLCRRPARFGSEGQVITLEHQDRLRWNAEQREEGLRWSDEVLARGNPGAYSLQAAIAACHARAARADQTDFHQIARWYERLAILQPSPVVRLNQAVARGLADGPGVGIALLDVLASEPALDRYAYFHASRAEFLTRLGRKTEAAAAYRQAEDLTHSPTEKRFLQERRSALGQTD